MPAKLPVRINLTESEQILYDQIDFSFSSGGDRARVSGKASRQLMESLLKRDAIPSARRSYFCDPFPGGRGKSHLQIFQTRLRDEMLVFEHSRFVHRYLRYFIYGPDLPVRTIERFCEIADEDDLDRLRAFVRAEIRAAARSERDYMPDEFYKLALECIPNDLGMARSIREAAMQAARRR